MKSDVEMHELDQSLMADLMVSSHVYTDSNVRNDDVSDNHNYVKGDELPPPSLP